MVNMEWMLNEINQDKKIDSSEIRRLDNVLKKPKNREELKATLDTNKKIFATSKESFQNTFREIKNWTTILTLEEQEMAKQLYEMLFWESSENLSEWIDVDEYIALSQSQWDIIQLDDAFAKKWIVSQPLIFNKNIIKSMYLSSYDISVAWITKKQDQRQKFNEFLKTEKWRQIWDDSQKFWQFENIYSKVGNPKATKETANAVIPLSKSYDKLIKDINNMSDELLSKMKHDWIKDYQQQATQNPMSRPEDFHLENARQISIAKAEFKEKLNWHMKDFAKNICKTVLAQDISKIKNWEIVHFNIWRVDVKLDFSTVKDLCEWKDTKEIASIVEQNFDKIYRDSIPEIAVDELFNVMKNLRENPTDASIEATAIIFAWLSATALTTETWWLWILQAWTTYSLVHDAVKANIYAVKWMIEWVQAWDPEKAEQDKSGNSSLSNLMMTWIHKWVNKWMWYWEDMNDRQYLAKKGMEYLSNYALFSIFNLTWKAMAKIWFSEFESKLALTSVKWVWTKAGIEWAKLWVEAWFFTWFQYSAWGLDLAMQDKLWPQSVMWEKKFSEALDAHYQELGKPENLINSFIYNTMFVSLVKTWWYLGWKLIQSPAEASMRHRLAEEQLMQTNAQLVWVVQDLDKRWYKIIWLSEKKKWTTVEIVDREWKAVPYDSPELVPLANVLAQLNSQWKELQRLSYNLLRTQENTRRTVDDNTKWKSDPESGRWGTKNDITLSWKSLEDVLRWFKKDWNMASRFESMLKDFKSLKNYDDIKWNVELQIQQEAKQYLWKDKLEPEELAFTKEKAEEFMLLLEKRAKWDNIESVEVDWKRIEYSEQTRLWLTEKLDLFVKNMDEKLKNDIYWRQTDKESTKF